MHSLHHNHLFVLVLLFISCKSDSESFSQIGVVEGFYGTPWSHEARLDMIRFMGSTGFNAYYYAPKDDPFHRSRWREPYSGEHLERFSELIETSREAGIDVYFAISPGLNMVYSDSSDFEALTLKLRDMTHLGVRHMALFFDDVPEVLQSPEDKKRFTDLAEAHIYVINRLWNELQDEIDVLTVCPTTYTAAWGSRAYIEKLGRGIPEEIALFWTGEDVAVPGITRRQASAWMELIQKKPLIWDNFPVNDFEVWRPILGPLTGRDANLYKSASGIIANPMDKPYASMIPLYTVSSYANDPMHYKPNKVLKQAVRFLAGDEAYPLLFPIVEVYSDYGWTDNLFTPVYTPGKFLDYEKLIHKLDEMDENLRLLSAPPFNKHPYVSKVVPELIPFVEKTRRDLETLTALNLIPETIQSGYEHIWDDARLQVMVNNNHLEIHLDIMKPNPRHEWIILLTGYKNPPETWLLPEDLIVRWKLQSDSAATAWHFYLTPFSQRGISDIRVRTISSFFEHFLQPSAVQIVSEHISDATVNRYVVHLPKPESDTIRFNVFLNPGNTLAKLPYLGNPHTYPYLVVEP